MGGKLALKRTTSLIISSPLLVYFLLVMIKLLLIKSAAPTVFGDEYFYKTFSLSIFQRLGYESVLYPLLYPMFLAISFLFGDYFYRAMIFLNIIVSSLIVFPISLLAKKLFGKKWIAFFNLIALLLPFNYVYPRYILSENLFFPLFLTAVYLLLDLSDQGRIKLSNYGGFKQGFKPTSLWFFGLVLGLMSLTKHIALVMEPVFLLILFLILMENRGLSWFRRLHYFMQTCLAALLVYWPWLYLGRTNNFSLIKIMGLDLSGGLGVRDYLAFDNLLIWLALYASYFVLMAGPFLVLLILAPFLWISKQLSKPEKYLFFLTAGLCLALGLVSARHSWRASYNYPQKQYILGRYVLYPAVLFLFLELVVIKRLKRAIKTRRHLKLSFLLSTKSIKSSLLILFSGCLSVGLMIFSFLALVRGGLWPISGSFISSVNAPDLFIYKSLNNKMGIIFFLFLLIVNLLVVVVVLKKISLAEKLFLLITILFSLLSGVNFVYHYLSSNKAAPSIHGRIIYDILSRETKGFQDEEKVVVYSALGVPEQRLTQYVDFWNTTEADFVFIKGIDQWKQSDQLTFFVFPKDSFKTQEGELVEGYSLGKCNFEVSKPGQ